MAYDPYPPPNWGAPSPHVPPPKSDTGRTVAIVIASVVGVLVLVPVLIGLMFFLIAFVSSTGEPPEEHRRPPGSMPHRVVEEWRG